MGLARARPAAGLIFGFVIAQGFAPASDLSRFENPSSAPPASADEGVLVSTDKLLYPVGETIVVQVANTLDTPVTTRDQRFECTIIGLERRSESGADWTEIRNCLSGAPVSEVTLQTGTTTTIRLESGVSMSGPLEPGVYRAVLDYSLGDRLSLAPGKLLVARSEQFRLE